MFIVQLLKSVYAKITRGRNNNDRKKKNKHVLDCVCSSKWYKSSEQKSKRLESSEGPLTNEGHLNQALKDRNELEWGMGRQGNIVKKKKHATVPGTLCRPTHAKYSVIFGRYW